jgi:hypothetical protein
MAEAIDQAWEVLREAMVGSGIPQRTSPELLRAVEAAAWLERIAETGRHLFVPAAKGERCFVGRPRQLDGRLQSYGSAPIQAGHRGVGGERQAGGPHLERARVSSLWRRPETPAEFDPLDTEFVRALGPAWVYTGPLEPAIQWLRAHHSNVVVYEDGGSHIVRSTCGREGGSASGETEEDAWRGHLGYVLAKGRPWPDDALPGETMAELRERTGGE